MNIFKSYAKIKTVTQKHLRYTKILWFLFFLRYLSHFQSYISQTCYDYKGRSLYFTNQFNLFRSVDTSRSYSLKIKLT